MSTPIKQRLSKSTYSSSPNRFQILAPSSPAPSLRPSPSYLQIAGSSPRSPSPYISTQDFPPFPRNLTQSIPSPSRVQTHPPPSPSSSQPSKRTQYFSKNKKEPIIILEPEYHDLSSPVINFQEISKKIFLDNFYFLTEDILKDYKFYEYILIDTDSVEIEHNYDSKDTSRICYSKIRILRVLTPKEFSTSLYTTRTFSNPSCLLQYSYLDYKKAWFNVFFIRPFSHSWFIQFHYKMLTPLPQWFYHWWSYFGFTRDILPDPVIQGFEEYKRNYSTNSSPSLLSFSIQFSIPWILAWTFQIEEIDHIRWLVREFNIKWWTNFKTDQACISAVRKWISSKPQTSTSTSFSEDFKTKKSRLQMALANASSEEEFQRIITELQSFNSSTNTEKDDSNDSQEDQDDFFSQFH